MKQQVNRIYLAEIVNKILDEALGVPDNINEVAKKVTKDLIEELFKSEKPDTRVINFKTKKEIIKFPNPITIKDETWNKGIIVTFSIEPRPDTTRYKSAAVNYDSELDPELRVVMVKPRAGSEQVIDLRISYEFDWNKSLNQVKEYLKENQDILEATISHELAHAFNFRKNSKVKAAKFGKYNISSDTSKSTAINKFNDDLYYVHSIENSVRPSEFLSYIKNKKINTKEEFIEFLRNSEIYKRLDSIRKLTFDSLKQNIEKESHKVSVEDILINNAYEIIFKIEEYDPEDAFVNRFTDDNYEAFYEYEIKQMNRAADKTIKKLAKLYAYDNKDDNETIEKRLEKFKRTKNS